MLPEQTHQLIPGFLLKTEQGPDTPQSKYSRTALSRLLAQLSGPVTARAGAQQTLSVLQSLTSAQGTRTPSTKAGQPGGYGCRLCYYSHGVCRNRARIPSRHLMKVCECACNSDRHFYTVCVPCLFPALHSPPRDKPGVVHLARSFFFPLGTSVGSSW